MDLLTVAVILSGSTLAVASVEWYLALKTYLGYLSIIKKLKEYEALIDRLLHPEKYVHRID